MNCEAALRSPPHGGFYFLWLQQRYQLVRRPHSDDGDAVRPCQRGNAVDSGAQCSLDRIVDAFCEATFFPSGFHLVCGRTVCLGERDERLGFRDIGALRKERARNRMMESSRRIVAADLANQLRSFQREARVDIALRRIDGQADSSCHADETLAYGRPSLRRERLRRPFGRRLGMQLERQPAQRRTETFCRFFGPD